MTKHLERLRCRLCHTVLLTYDGLGQVTETLTAWHSALAEHRPHCTGPSPLSAPPLPGHPASQPH